ncbi:MAG TPA: DJ-1/PfpI family protein, partial [Thermoanaerobaculia bacterium]|nr:DJ-1/PfpI family protein [Thermoanaerobaculia bacterium]
MQVVIVAPEEAEILDIAGPAEIFRSATEVYESLHPKARGPYSVKVISSTHELMIRTSSGLELKADDTFRTFTGPVDTLLIAGGLFKGIMKTSSNRDLLRWLIAVSRDARRTGSICTGAFVLAAAGLLRGKRATTHWSRISDLSRMYPDIRVDPIAIYTVDG